MTATAPEGGSNLWRSLQGHRPLAQIFTPSAQKNGFSGFWAQGGAVKSLALACWKPSTCLRFHKPRLLPATRCRNGGALKPLEPFAA